MAGPGTSTGAGTKVGVTLKLAQLQNLCKRDPDGYREDYDAQVRRLVSELGILALQPDTEPSKSLIELIQFAAAVASSSYKGEESERIAGLLLNLLVGSNAIKSADYQQPQVDNVSNMPSAALQLHREVRATCVSGLILMRNKGAVQPLQLLESFFRIMATVPDKALRTQLYKHIVNDVRNLNKNGKRDEKVNRAIQSFLHRVVTTHGTVVSSTEDSATDVAARRATDMVCELYRRRVWTDERAVAIVASAVQSQNPAVMCRAIRFFLGIEEKMADDTKQQKQENVDEHKVDYHLHSKKTKAHARQTQKQIKERKKALRKKEEAEWTDITPEDDKGVEACKKLFPAIELLRDPQGLAEAVFKRLRHAGSIKFETKILMVNFITRLVGNHELLLLPLYPFLQKYMGGNQRNVTAVLAYTVQACHEYVPPDEIHGVLKTIAHNFITERCSEEQMAVGINAARAICARVPAALSVEEGKESSAAMDVEAFARELAAFAKHRDRSVAIAGKAWMNFVRETFPGLLQGKHRGVKGTALHMAGTKPLRYGQTKVASGVEGADLLAEYEAKKAAQKGDERYEENESDDEEEDGDDGEDDGDDGEDDGDEEEQAESEDDDEEEVADDDASDDEEAPTLVNLDTKGAATAVSTDKEQEEPLQISKMTAEERDKLKQEMSSTRIFNTKDFERMRRLIDRENRLKRDPREAARRKRALARGGVDFQALSGDEDDDDGGSSQSETEGVKIAGAVTERDIMAIARKKRQSKAERLEQVVAGRAEREAKSREGGSTNVEKTRKKNFVMTKFSFAARGKAAAKSTLKRKRKDIKKQIGHETRKRRRKG